MKRYSIIVALLSLMVFGEACKKDSDFLDKKPTDAITIEELWSDPNLVLTVVGDLYDRYPDFQRIDRWAEFTSFDEAFASSGGDYGRHQNAEYGFDAWNSWDYGYLREINLFLQRAGEPTNTMDQASTDRFVAEARFIRAGVYFEIVKRMGGVPLILEPLTYDGSGDPSYLQKPKI